MVGTTNYLGECMNEVEIFVLNVVNTWCSDFQEAPDETMYMGHWARGISNKKVEEHGRRKTERNECVAHYG